MYEDTDKYVLNLEGIVNGFYWSSDGSSCQLISHPPEMRVPKILQVIYNDPYTIVRWADDTKTIVKCGFGEKWDEEIGLSMAIVKKMFGSRSAFQAIVDGAYRQPPKEDPDLNAKFVDPLFVDPEYTTTGM